MHARPHILRRLGPCERPEALLPLVARQLLTGACASRHVLQGAEVLVAAWEHLRDTRGTMEKRRRRKEYKHKF